MVFPESSRVRPSFLGFHRFIEMLCRHTNTGVQQLYEASYVSECIVMNSHSLVESLVAGCLVGRTGGRTCLLISGFPLAPFANLAGLLSHVGKAEIRYCVGRFSLLRRMVAWGVG